MTIPWSSSTRPWSARAIHPIDDRRIYLFGHSAGAQFALALVLLDSDYYAAAAIHAGTLPPGIMPALSLPHRRMPVAIWVGDRDPNFPADAVRETKRVMDANGYDVRLSVVAQHDHDYYAVSGTVNASAWAFLKQYQLPASPPS
jgi:predicted esterase